MKVMIVGAGKLGQKLAEFLVMDDIDVTLVDYNEKVLERVNEHLDVLTVTASGVDITILKELDIKSYDLLVACTKGDETNTVICSLAKRLGCKKTVARIRNPEYMKQLDFVKKEMGIDNIVNPEMEIAKVISRYLLKNISFYSDDFAKGKVTMIDFNINHIPYFINKKIKELDNFKELLITAVSRNGKIIIPDGSTTLLENDIIHVIGNSDNVKKFSSDFEAGKHVSDIHKVMIFGGGRVGYYLAKALTASNIEVTIVEQDKVRCKELADILNDVLVIHGDGTDIHLLEEENLEQMDAFVGATGFDEMNLLMALMAKQAGVPKTIAKYSRPNYSKIIDKLGVDVALNTVLITASNILKYIRGGKVVSVSLLLGGDAEVTEIVIGEDMNFIGKKLVDLNLPKGIVIGSIVRDGEVIIPNGSSFILPGDRIIVFSLNADIPVLKMFFTPKKGGLLGELWNRTKSTR